MVLIANELTKLGDFIVIIMVTGKTSFGILHTVLSTLTKYSNTGGSPKKIDKANSWDEGSLTTTDQIVFACTH